MNIRCFYTFMVMMRMAWKQAFIACKAMDQTLRILARTSSILSRMASIMSALGLLVIDFKMKMAIIMLPFRMSSLD